MILTDPESAQPEIGCPLLFPNDCRLSTNPTAAFWPTQVVALLTAKVILTITWSGIDAPKLAMTMSISLSVSVESCTFHVIGNDAGTSNSISLSPPTLRQDSS